MGEQRSPAARPGSVLDSRTVLRTRGFGIGAVSPRSRPSRAEAEAEEGDPPMNTPPIVSPEEWESGPGRSCSSRRRRSRTPETSGGEASANALARRGDDSHRRSQSVLTHPIEENDMAATYTFDVFSSLDGYGAAGGTGPATGAGKAPSCSTTALPCTAQSSGWSSAPPRIGHSRGCWLRAPREFEVRDPWVTRMRSLPATVVSTTLKEPPRLAGRDPRER